MTVKKHATKVFKHLNMPVSYQVLDGEGLLDARNVFDNKGVTETRYGIKKYNSTSLGGEVLSLSFFQHSNGNQYKIAKVGTTLVSVSATGAHTTIKTGLTATTKHRAVTMNDRHIIAIEGDGLFSWEGNGNIIPLGQARPSAPTIVTNPAGGTLTGSTAYQVAITFYSSSTGFESDFIESNSVTTSGGTTDKIIVSSMPTTATNTTMDKKRIYLKKASGEYLLCSFSGATEIALATASQDILANTLSTITPPEADTRQEPRSGGGKYLAIYGNRLIYTGSDDFPGEVFISEEYMPDAFSRAVDATILEISGQGPITGLGVGFFNDSTLNPYIVAFKKTTTTVYSELGGNPSLSVIDEQVGCISHDTIKVRNGSVVFMSEHGWYLVHNGLMAKDSQGIPARLGSVDDIFTRKGWTNELNIPQASRFFSAYYTSDLHYMTFIAEGASTSLFKAYVFEERINGFRIFSFKTALTCATESQDSDGRQEILLGDAAGTLFTYSGRNERHDEDETGASETIPAYLVMPYIMPGEDANSYNFRTLAVRAIASENIVNVKSYASFGQVYPSNFEYSFPNTGTGFTLDVSQLDIDTLGDEKTPVTYMADLNMTGEVLLVKFEQDILDANIGLISAQLSCNKNGNRNS